MNRTIKVSVVRIYFLLEDKAEEKDGEHNVDVNTEATDAVDKEFTKLNMDPSADKFVMTADLYSRLSADQQRYTKELTRIVVKSYQPTIVRNLIVLAGSAKGIKAGIKTIVFIKPAPKWFSKKISELLTER